MLRCCGGTPLLKSYGRNHVGTHYKSCTVHLNANRCNAPRILLQRVVDFFTLH